MLAKKDSKNGEEILNYQFVKNLPKILGKILLGLPTDFETYRDVEWEI